jgi:hypothetical protein
VAPAAFADGEAAATEASALATGAGSCEDVGEAGPATDPHAVTKEAVRAATTSPRPRPDPTIVRFPF